MSRMKKIGLISCSKKKRDGPGPAYHVYSASTLFSKAFEYAVRNYDVIYILSAKYGVIIPSMWIAPYDETLSKMTPSERMRWSEEVVSKFRFTAPSNAQFFFHAGKLYREHVIPRLERRGFECHTPLEGMGIGQQLQWYTNRLKELSQTKLSDPGSNPGT
jgi:hypothetical protein